MKKINEIIVVEGKTDVDFLSSFISADFIKSEGTSLPKEVMDMLINFSKNGRDIIVLTDPDAPGERIRKQIQEKIPSAKHAFVRARFSKRGKKLGVAESTKEEVLRALENIVSFQNSTTSLEYSDFYDLGLVGTPNSSYLREKISEMYFVGHGSAKTIYKRLNMLNVSKEDLEKSLEEILNARDRNV